MHDDASCCRQSTEGRGAYVAAALLHRTTPMFRDGARRTLPAGAYCCRMFKFIDAMAIGAVAVSAESLSL